MEKHKRFKAGIIGTGKATSISSAHLKGYQSCGDVELIGVYNRHRATSEAWCDAFGLDHALCCDSWEKLIEDADFISICTPNAFHADYLCACLEHNTNVLCEKPVSSTGADIPRIRAALEESTALSMVNLNYRRIPGIRLLRTMLSSGEYGAIYTIRHNMGASRLANEAVELEWRFQRALSGTGVLGDFGTHALDLLQFLTGVSPAQLNAVSVKTATVIPERRQGSALRAVENEDCAMVLATLPGGGLYNLTLSRVGCTDSRLEIVTARGIFLFELAKPTQLTVQTRVQGGGYGAAKTITAKDASPEWRSGNPAAGAYLSCADNVACFVGTVRCNAQPDTTIEYGLSLLEAVERLDTLAVKG